MLILVGWTLAGPALALRPDEVLPDTAMESRAREISAGLRCLVCQNQSIDDSDAPLARDLRLLVRERVKAGDDNGAVQRYVVERYGEFVLLKPVFAWHTALLWLAPFALLAAGFLALWTKARRARPAPPPPLSEQERAALEKLAGEASDLSKIS